MDSGWGKQILSRAREHRQLDERDLQHIPHVVQIGNAASGKCGCPWMPRNSSVLPFLSSVRLSGMHKTKKNVHGRRAKKLESHSGLPGNPEPTEQECCVTRGIHCQPRGAENHTGGWRTITSGRKNWHESRRLNRFDLLLQSSSGFALLLNILLHNFCHHVKKSEHRNETERTPHAGFSAGSKRGAADRPSG